MKAGGSQEQTASPRSELPGRGGGALQEPPAAFLIPVFQLLLQPLALTLHLRVERRGFENVASGYPASHKCTIDFSR